MQLKRALELKKEWGDKPCDHPQLVKEYFQGAQTGDYVCTQCGQSGPGRNWNKKQEE